MNQADVRQYAARAVSTDTFGRVMCSARDQHFVVDGPVQNGCPGEAITPAELFLSGVAACGVELVQVLAKTQGVPLSGVSVDISGTMDRSRPPRPDVSLFNSVHLRIRMKGVSEQQGKELLDAFKGR
ncbi:MAG TPA: OsmC family protein [Terriglobales bacterium]